MPYFLDPEANQWTYCGPAHAHVRRGKGQREAVAADFNFRETRAEHLWLRDVDGERVEPLTDRPVLLVGRGTSKHAGLPGAYTIAVNPHADSVYGNKVDACFSGDRNYWKEHYFDWRAKNPAPQSVWLTNPASGKYPFWKSKHRGSRAVTMGEWPIAPCVLDHWPVILSKGVPRYLTMTPAPALLYALQVTSGPVVLAGFDLEGNNCDGTSYKNNQFWKWELLAKVVDRSRISCHAAMRGPVVSLFGCR